jgi:hypothetical protein
MRIYAMLFANVSACFHLTISPAADEPPLHSPAAACPAPPAIRYDAARARFCRARTPEALAAFTLQLDREWAWLAHCRRSAAAAAAGAGAAAPASGPGVRPVQRCLRSQRKVGRLETARSGAGGAGLPRRVRFAADVPDNSSC